MKLSIRQDGAHDYSILDDENQICVAQTGSKLWANRIIAYPRLVEEVKIFLEYIKMLQEQFPGKLTATTNETEALLTELKEI